MPQNKNGGRRRAAKVERVPRTVIEGKLLAALDDELSVAVTLNGDDLDAVIEALSWYCQHAADDARQRSLRRDLKKLRKAAFG